MKRSCGLFPDAGDKVRLHTTATQYNVPRKCGPYGELFFFLLMKEPIVLRELVRMMPNIRPNGEHLLLLVQKEPACVPDSDAFNSSFGDGFLIPELNGGSEASEDDQAEDVSNEALFVIGLHGSGDKIRRTCKSGRWQRLPCAAI